MRSLVGAALVVAVVGCGDSREPLPRRTAVDPTRCTLRVSAKGLYVDGAPTSQADAVAICKQRTAAMVVLEDGVTEEWTQVKQALRREGVQIVLRGPVGHAECTDNPLAKGCS